MSVDISDLMVRRADQEVESAQAERRMVEAEIGLAKVKFEHSSGLEKELASTRQDIDECNGAISTMQAVIALLRKGQPRAEDALAVFPSLRITRRGAQGLTVIPAIETTPLEPGDIVQVNSPDRADGTTSRDTQAMGRP
jgi:septation ring formation regulator EzrA